MSGVLIVRPMTMAVPAVVGSGAANLLTADPNEAWIAPAADPIALDIDMGAEVAVDSFFLGYSNAAVGATWTIARGTGPGTGLVEIKPAGPMRAADSLGPRHHAFHRLAAPVAGRYFRLSLSQAGAQPLYAGALIVGLALEKHREFGAGRTIIDTASREDLPGGGFGIGDGVVKTQFAFSFIDLTDAEQHALDAIKRDRGLTRTLLVVEDADLAIGRNEAMHYGVFDRFQARESVDAEVGRWAGSVIDWA